LNVGQRYWTENLLWQTDTYRSDRRSVYWSSALDTLLHAVSTDTDHPTPEHNLPPSGTGPLSVIGGVRAPKARLLGRVVVCADDGAAARLLTSPEFQGQVALVTLPPDGPERGPVFPSGLNPMACDPAELPGERAEASRIDVARERDASDAVRSVNFSANRAEFDVENGPRPAVFAYSDAWNEHWQARVNGNVATVLHSDLAYKAVIVPPGKSRVVFEYRDRLADLVFLLQELASGSFVAILITLAIRRRTESRFRL
jgi:hypothetical protein